MEHIKVKCSGVISYKSMCPKRMECKFYLDLLNNTAEPYSHVIFKKEKKEMICFKPI